MGRDSDFENIVLAHHPRKEYARCCIPVPLPGRRLHLCARCFGAVLGMASAAALGAPEMPLFLVLAVVLASVLHWGSGELRIARWGRWSRTGAGFGMGFTYAAVLLRAALTLRPFDALAAAGLTVALLAAVLAAKLLGIGKR